MKIVNAPLFPNWFLLIFSWTHSNIHVQTKCSRHYLDAVGVRDMGLRSVDISAIADCFDIGIVSDDYQGVGTY